MPEQKTDPQDILIVQNCDLNCNYIDSEEGWSHADFFQVKYGGAPLRIKPGETRRVPRYRAEHFAKHLADHMLMKMEEETGKQFLVNNVIERPKMLNQILTGVDTYYLEQDQGPSTEVDKLATEDKQLNPEDDTERAMDIGEVPNPMIGTLKATSKTPPVPKSEPEDDKKTSIFDPSKDKPTRQQLIKACADQGIEWTMKNTNEELIAKLKAF
jgi:hypothetical protein